MREKTDQLGNTMSYFGDADVDKNSCKIQKEQHIYVQRMKLINAHILNYLLIQFLFSNIIHLVAQVLRLDFITYLQRSINYLHNILIII